MNVSVIIVTLNRPDCVRRCLDCLVTQEPRPDQLVVVDASADTLTRDVVADFEGVEYLRNENGYGRMTASRNIGLKVAKGEIIAFLDDDAFAHAGWLQNLVTTYESPKTGMVGGRALNLQPPSKNVDLESIGALSPNGVLLGNFDADPGKTIEVSHVMGCNMSFRREVLAKLGGFREDYPGISGVREDSDMCLRVRRLGYEILFNPAAAVDHIGAPQAKGNRFDARYNYYGQRNHMVLLIRNYGLTAPVTWRYIAYGLVRYGGEEFAKRLASALLQLAVIVLGTAIGLASGVQLLLRKGSNPVRRDSEGQAIRKALGGAESQGAELSFVPAPRPEEAAK